MPVLTAFALLLSLALPLAAQNPNRPLDMAIDASVRTRVIDGVLGRLNEGYVFPQMAAEMERAVRALAQRGGVRQHRKCPCVRRRAHPRSSGGKSGPASRGYVRQRRSSG